MCVVPPVCSFPPAGWERPGAVGASLPGSGVCHGEVVASQWSGLTVAAGLPARGVAVVRAIGEIDLRNAPRWARLLARRGTVWLSPGGAQAGRPERAHG
jgi:hypothetical protein